MLSACQTGILMNWNAGGARVLLAFHCLLICVGFFEMPYFTVSLVYVSLTLLINKLRYLKVCRIINYWYSAHHKSQQMNHISDEISVLWSFSFNFVDDSGFRRVISTTLSKFQSTNWEYAIFFFIFVRKFVW